MLVLNQPQQFNLDSLRKALNEFLGEIDSTLFDELKGQVEWLELAGGDVLMREGDPGNSLFFVISGRLRASIQSIGGAQQAVGEIIRGETVGEMAIFTGEARSATVVAIRDSVLVRLSRSAFEQIIKRHPVLAISVTRLIVDRLKRSSNPHLAIKRPVNLCLLAITEEVDTVFLGKQLVAALCQRAPAVMLDSQGVDEILGDRVSQSDKGDADAYRRLSAWLDETEAKHDFVVFVADKHPSGWTNRCIRQSDEILLIAQSDAPVRIHPLETQFISHSDSAENTPQLASGALQRLVLLHPNDQTLPRNTAAWLDRRAIASHIHIRPDLPKDISRLARILAGQANGLVFAGGGAKGFAHLGVYKALEEFGVPIDYVGGASIGAVMAAYVGFDLPADRVIELAREAFRENPTGDFNPLPLLSLIGGRKLKKVIDSAIVNAVGFSCSVEDTWRSYFCVVSNYTRAEEMVIRRGAMDRSVRASVSIPAALPPVVLNHELMVDGGVFNNFPVDVMLQMQAARVIGVDLLRQDTRRYDLYEMPSTIALLRDRTRPRRKRQHHLPSLLSTMFQATILASTHRQRAARDLADLCFQLDLGRVGMLDWKRFDQIVQLGYDQARLVLAALPPETLARYR